MTTGTPTELDILLQSLGLAKSPIEQPARVPQRASAAAEDMGLSTVSAPGNAGIYQERRHTAGEKSPSSLSGTDNKTVPQESFGQSTFIPFAPNSLEATGIRASDVSDLLLKCLLNSGVESGAQLANHLGLRFAVVELLLRQLKLERYVSYKGSVSGHDYLYELTDLGREMARQLVTRCTYSGTAPVALKHYVESVKAQSLTRQRPPLSSIRAAFAGLHLKEKLLSSIGQAIHSGRGMFLYGPPGNGKTSFAERVTRSYGDTIWIPRTISASGEIIRLFDPNLHRPVPVDDELPVDGRWIQIERPTITAGGELRMDDLEIQYIRGTGVGEAPLQLKANGGTLLIDDFGRQRMNIDELLNRWIVPLEQRHDFLHLESGRTIQVPFDQLIVFSSNLEPRDLVDDAFLRRIPYKISVRDPEEQEFRQLFGEIAETMGLQIEPGVTDYLVNEHYIRGQRPFRYCHPRDLCRQVENRCTLHELSRVITREAIDQAVENYFSIV